MSLSKSEIVYAKKLVNEIIDLNNQLLDIKQIKKIINDDDNFLTFIEGTNIGMDLYLQLEELISLVVDYVYEEVDSLNTYTLNFINRLLDETENLNN